MVTHSDSLTNSIYLFIYFIHTQYAYTYILVNAFFGHLPQKGFVKWSFIQEIEFKK